MSLAHLDSQLLAARSATEVPVLSDRVWDCLATTIHDEIAGLDEAITNLLRVSVLIPPERYVEELTAFQTWMDIAHANADNPVVVRAQVMTEIYVAFVWLRDSLMKPTAAAVLQPDDVRHHRAVPQQRPPPNAPQCHRPRSLVLPARLQRPGVLGRAEARPAPPTFRDQPNRTRRLAAPQPRHSDRGPTRPHRRWPLTRSPA